MDLGTHVLLKDGGRIKSNRMKNYNPQEKWAQENAKKITIKLYQNRDKEILEWWKNIAPGEKANTFRRMAKKEIEKKE